MIQFMCGGGFDNYSENPTYADCDNGADQNKRVYRVNNNKRRCQEVTIAAKRHTHRYRSMYGCVVRLCSCVCVDCGVGLSNARRHYPAG